MIPNFENIRQYTYRDYEEWDENFRCELIDGYIYMMASPTFLHQYLSRLLFRQFDRYLEGKICDIFAAPLDVRLFPKKDKSDKTVVQPDLMVICDKTRINHSRTCYLGSPELVIEILSPHTRIKDLYDKKGRYWLAGVKEYWIVFDEHHIQVNTLNTDSYSSIDYLAAEGVINVPVHLLGWDLTITINNTDIPIEYRTKTGLTITD